MGIFLKILKVVFITLGIFIGIVFLLYVFVLKGFHSTYFGIKYMDKGIANVAGFQQNAKFNICKYQMPEGYKLIRFMDSVRGKHKTTALVLLGKEGGDKTEYYLVYRMPLFHKVDLDTISVKNNSHRKRFSYGESDVCDGPIPAWRKVLYLKVEQSLPFFWTGKNNPANHTLILRGLDADTQEQVTEEKCTARIWYGTLNNLGLDKKQDRFYRNTLLQYLTSKGPVQKQ